MGRRATILVAFLWLAGCMPATLVRVAPVPLPQALTAQQASIVEGTGLSRYTRELLSREVDVTPVASVEARYAAAARATDVRPVDRALALAELALQSALRIEGTVPQVAQERFLLAADQANEALLALTATPGTAAFDGRLPLAREMYNLATAKFLDGLIGHGRAPRPLQTTVAGRRFQVVFDDAETLRTLAYYDEATPAWTLGVDGLRTRYERDGLGVPFVGWRAARSDAADWHYGPDGLAAPLTAWLAFEDRPDGSRKVRVLLRDSREETTTCVNGQVAPLAADFTAPLAYAWSHSRAYKLGIEGFRGAAEAENVRGFRLLEPYDPRRIPLVLVHGLASSPQVWRNLTNDVLGSPELRERYQVWHYSYPTAEPFLVAAQHFRADLRALLDALRVPQDAGIVVVGHSMGGLLAKSLVVDSGSALWDAVFTVPPDRLRASDETRKALQEALVLRPWPEIGRVVFVGTPHGGSELADRWWARLVEQLIEGPTTLRVQLQGILQSGPDQLRPALRTWFERGRATSVDALRPSQPLLQAFRALPIDPRVPYDTFYGTADKDPLGRVGDGVVRAADARLAGAASEHGFPVRHRDFDTPAVLTELRRVLEAHADARGLGDARAVSVQPCRRNADVVMAGGPLQ